MPEKIARQIFEYQLRHGALQEKNRSLYEYAYQLLVSRVFTYLTAFGLGIITGSLKEIILFLLFFTPLRQYAGGFHMKKASSCILTSGVLICIVAGYWRIYPGMRINNIVGWGIAVMAILILAPVDCDGKRLDMLEKRVYRKRTYIFLGIEIAVAGIAFLVHYPMMIKGIVLSHEALAIILILGYGMDQRKFFLRES